MNLRRLNSELHRDIGFFLSGLILVYCVSGIALNHVHDWNPDFVIHKRTVTLDRAYADDEVTEGVLAQFTALVDEDPPKVHDFPAPGRVKLYYDNASLLVDLTERTAEYERIHRRPLFYHLNVLHRNSLKGWRWVSDVVALLLIFVTISGWFAAKGRTGLMGRGKWWVLAGILPPLIALAIFQWVQR